MSARYPVPLHTCRTHIYVRRHKGMRTNINSLKINGIQIPFNAERNNEEKTTAIEFYVCVTNKILELLIYLW
jgi:hypothetical protein